MNKIIKMLLIIIVCSLIVGLLIFFLSRTKIIKENNIDNYLEYLNDLQLNKDVHSKLYIFPSKINKEKTELFEYLRKESLFDGSYLFYIIINYDENEYNEEINRIKEVKKIFKYGEKYPIYVEGDKYPAYITISDGYDTYEYALLDEENNKIIYVFRQLYYYDSKLKNEYYFEYKVPKNQRDIKRPGYNMYYYYDSDGVGVIDY
jgi:hypothetical protein